MWQFTVWMYSTYSVDDGDAEYHVRESHIQNDARDLAQHILAGWESANAKPAVGDAVVPGIHYRGPPLAQNAIGVIVGKGTGGFWDIKWNHNENDDTRSLLRYGDA